MTKLKNIDDLIGHLDEYLGIEEFKLPTFEEWLKEYLSTRDPQEKEMTDNPGTFKVKYKSIRNKK